MEGSTIFQVTEATRVEVTYRAIGQVRDVVRDLPTRGALVSAESVYSTTVKCGHINDSTLSYLVETVQHFTYVYEEPVHM
ncbi:hypothetical protein GE061_006257 [Apolygus lucorum]|uniref:Uncharacterized protein n=1 Tax=Apolygus lucorum TaxID=248454 RepID=A0A8S9WUS4_APOLU|nr:hypothetical protein GE061_006257 [Apolygus lucorum]